MCVGPTQAQTAPPSIKDLARGPAGQRPLIGTQFGVIDPNRPVLFDQNGHPETEKGITVNHPHLNGGAWTNIPSIWNGQHFQGDERGLEDWAVSNALKEGREWPSYPTVDSAVEVIGRAACRERGCEN